ncbi:MAG: hypothetical protein L0Z53_02020, partial [Acidobacteriales bacterium]|nr:hypothetical protein [Terriglobales bacterium]
MAAVDQGERMEYGSANASVGEDTRGIAPATSLSNAVLRPAELAAVTRAKENAELQERMAAVENRMTALSQSVTQSPALPPQFNQLTFFNVGSAGRPEGAADRTAAPSPELQRALLLGVARQLGWLTPSTPGPQAQQEQRPEDGTAAPQTDLGVEFVDLPSVAAETPAAQTGAVEPSTTAQNTPNEDGTKKPVEIPVMTTPTSVRFPVDSQTLGGPESAAVYITTEGGPAVYQGTVPFRPGIVSFVTIPIQVRAWSSDGAPIFHVGSTASGGTALYIQLPPANTPSSSSYNYPPGFNYGPNYNYSPPSTP